MVDETMTDETMVDEMTEDSMVDEMTDETMTDDSMVDEMDDEMMELAAWQTITLTDVGKRYGSTEALNGLTFEVARGEMFGLIDVREERSQRVKIV